MEAGLPSLGFLCGHYPMSSSRLLCTENTGNVVDGEARQSPAEAPAAPSSFLTMVASSMNVLEEMMSRTVLSAWPSTIGSHLQEVAFATEGASTTTMTTAALLAIVGLVLLSIVLLRGSSTTEKVRGLIKAGKDAVVSGGASVRGGGKGGFRRFRKRDKIVFMGQKAFRRAKAVGTLIKGGQGKKRRAVARLVRKVLFDGPRSNSGGSSSKGAGRFGFGEAGFDRLRLELPDAFFEEEFDDQDPRKLDPEGAADGHEGHPPHHGSLPEALFLVLKNMRIFCHLNLDDDLFFDIIRCVERLSLDAGERLFRHGEPDDHMYIVESGRVNVRYADHDSCSPPDVVEEGREGQLIKVIGPGEAYISQLKLIEFLGGRQTAFKNISAKACEKTTVLKIHFQGFKAAFENRPELLSRVINVVMLRLQRVTLLALHQYLGLGAEVLFRENLFRETLQGSPPQSGRSTESVRRSSSPINSGVASRGLEGLDYQELQQHSSRVFMQALGLAEVESEEAEEDIKRMQDYLSVSSWDDGDILVQEDASENPCLLLLLDGCLLMTQTPVDDGDGAQVEIRRVGPGTILCQLMTLTLEPSFYTLKAVGPTPGGIGVAKVASLEAKYIQNLMVKHPTVSLKLALMIIDNLAPYVRSVDFALEWLQLESGRALCRQGDQPHNTYVVLSGRLRSVVKKSGGQKEVLCEYARGDLTGIVETLLKTPFGSTTLAVRDSEVAKIPAGLVDAIKLRYPVVLLRLIKLLGQKMQASWELGGSSPGGPENRMASAAAAGHPGTLANTSFSTVALMPVSPGIPVTSFAFELLHALSQVDPVIRLSKEYVIEELGESAFEKSNDFKLLEWLTSQEDKNRTVLYQCDPTLNDWTRLCLRHADVVFMLADPKASPDITALERNLEDMFRRTRKDMIFLHDEDTRYPTGTAEWLKDRFWVNSHYHVKCPRRMFSKKTKYSKLVIQGPPPDINSDFSRLARVVTGQTVGLVLGGGGARGCSHVGIIRALLEAGIPIDHVGGVSIGSLIGGLYTRERDLTEVTVKARDFAGKVGQVWRWLMDLTLPVTSYFKGYQFNKILEPLFGSDTDMRDTWLPYFNITTNISNSTVRIHDYGSLWRYVRASMSLAGWMSPICDPHDGHLLLDGGYSNNLPADVMRTMGARYIFAVDVGAEDTSDFTNYGDYLSGFQILLSRISPFSEPMRIPSQTEVQLRLAYVSCVDKLESVKNSGYCEYIRPPITKYGTLQFHDFEEIKEVGYRHGVAYCHEFKKAGLMRQFYWWSGGGGGCGGGDDPLAGPAGTPGWRGGHRKSAYSVSAAMRRNSLENLASLSSSFGSTVGLGGGGGGSPSGSGSGGGSSLVDRDALSLLRSAATPSSSFCPSSALGSSSTLAAAAAAASAAAVSSFSARRRRQSFSPHQAHVFLREAASNHSDQEGIFDLEEEDSATTTTLLSTDKNSSSSSRSTRYVQDGSTGTTSVVTRTDNTSDATTVDDDTLDDPSEKARLARSGGRARLEHLDLRLNRMMQKNTLLATTTTSKLKNDDYDGGDTNEEDDDDEEFDSEDLISDEEDDHKSGVFKRLS